MIFGTFININPMTMERHTLRATQWQHGKTAFLITNNLKTKSLC